MAVAGVGVHFPVKVARLDAPVAGAQANVALQAVHRDAAVVRMQIDAPGQGICFHGTIPGVDKYTSMDGIRLNRAVAGLNLQVCLARHPDFDVQSPCILAPIPVPMAGNACGQFHSVAVLAGLHGEILAQLVTMVFNAKFDLFGVAGGDANAAVIRVHLYVGSTSHGVGLDDFFAPRVRAEGVVKSYAAVIRVHLYVGSTSHGVGLDDFFAPRVRAEEVVKSYAAVIRVHLYVGSTSHGVGLDDFFSPDPGRD